VSDDLDEWATDIASVETDTAQGRVRGGSGAAMQIVVGRHSWNVDVIREKASEVGVIDPRGLALQPGQLIRKFQLIGQ